MPKPLEWTEPNNPSWPDWPNILRDINLSQGRLREGLEHYDLSLLGDGNKRSEGILFKS